MCAMEGAVGALATSSGEAATTIAILNICRSGQHIVAGSTLYGGSYSLFSNTFPKLGIEVTFVDPDGEQEAIEAAFRPETKALFAEAIGNPGLNVLDFAKFARVAKEKGVPLIVDNTFPPLTSAAPSATAPISLPTPPRSTWMAMPPAWEASFSTEGPSTGITAGIRS